MEKQLKEIADARGFILNPKTKDKIISRLEKRDNHCPCVVEENDDTLCPCLNFRTTGHCCCNLFIKEN